MLRPIRVATFNVHHGAPPGRWFNASEFRRAVRRLDADVLALQEVDRRVVRSRFVDQTALAADATGLNPVFGRARAWGPFGDYGISLLAATAPSAVEVVKLPRFGGEQRIAIVATVTIRGIAVSVAATHLQNRREVAVDQLRVVIDRLRRRPGPHLLMGDLNAGPHDLAPLFARAGLVPAVALPTFPTHSPTKRIDWIATSGFEVSASEVPSVWLSDHFPLVVELQHIS